MPTIKIEGQTIDGDKVGITDEIANDDELLKAALVSSWPDVRTATFTRTGGKDGRPLVVTVAKKAGTKGGLIDRLFSAPDGENPAVPMSERITALARSGALTPEQVEKLLPEIAAAADLGARDLDAARASMDGLFDAGAVSAREVPLGF